MVIGIVVGVTLRDEDESFESYMKCKKAGLECDRKVHYVAYIGQLFIQMLECLVIPLITSSIISAIGGIDLSLSGLMGRSALVYSLSTTVISTILGLIMVFALQPGVAITGDQFEEGKNTSSTDALMDLSRNMIPENLVQATLYHYKTNEMDVNGRYQEGTNILGLVSFSIVLGMAMSKMEERAAPLQTFFTLLSKLMIMITGYLLWLSPLGIGSLIATQFLEMPTISKTLHSLGVYCVSVIVGLGIHGIIVLPCIYIICTHLLPFRFISRMSQALITAFVTASSSITLPVTISCMEQKNRIDPRVSKFVLPLGATVNMDGTALYMAVSAIFIAQVRQRTCLFVDFITVFITSTVVSIGTAGIPNSTIISIVITLNTLGLPAEDVSIILAVDWILDRFSTVINVLSDAVGAGIIALICRRELARRPCNIM